MRTHRGTEAQKNEHTLIYSHNHTPNRTHSNTHTNERTNAQSLRHSTHTMGEDVKWVVLLLKIIFF